ncbi:hypothetical protein FHG89_30625 [Micromonospora orduensis]|uniref:Uncharacterized protein n=1 Tax=Micromonospora orduensis TaxID=1420891 RepID=A0A5C4QD57_9ACTN|nr:hypothetical protein [Micromonospora orduensis]TNH21812.1 hypothetical protein FHG89_30625 [Micromonospora orduensis]
MSHRLWFRLDDVLPLAEHAAAASAHLRTRRQYRAGVPDQAALIWSHDADGDWLSSNGVPRWYDADGVDHRVLAETWSHTATGATGNPVPTEDGQGFLPLHTGHLDGRRDLLDLLRYARRHEMHWFGLHPDPASEATNDRYRISRQRGDISPPLATWTPATVTCDLVGGGAYRAMVATGYTTLSRTAVLCRFPRFAVQRMAAHLDALYPGDMPGEHPRLRFDGDEVAVEWEDDDGLGSRWFEDDRVVPDANRCYAIGAYRWPWTRVASEATTRATDPTDRSQ